LKNSRNLCSTLFFEEASDAIFCIPMIEAAVARKHTVNEFASNIERHRRELLIHCYRMFGSLRDAEDAVQETLLRAWRHRDSPKEGAPLRPRLYRVATNMGFQASARLDRVLERQPCSSFAHEVDISLIKYEVLVRSIESS
jgi:DNA-directed RNA polymerase specialized sigma24 family protein